MVSGDRLMKVNRLVVEPLPGGRVVGVEKILAGSGAVTRRCHVVGGRQVLGDRLGNLYDIARRLWTRTEPPIDGRPPPLDGCPGMIDHLVG